MFEIIHAQFIAPGIKRFRVRAPRIARKHKPGQFVIVRVHECGERIPLTIETSCAVTGVISMVVQSVGKTTFLLNTLGTGDSLMNVVGPLGRPSEIRNFGTVVGIGGGVGAAMLYPTALALKAAGNRFITVLGARTRDLIMLEREMRDLCDQLTVSTDDGSYGEKGLVTDVLRRLLEEGTAIDLVLAVGPIPMMKAVAETTREAHIRTIVSLNPIMIDGTGMCGGCRVLVDGKSQFACVDGPEFDAHSVDFDMLMQRNAMYRQREQDSLAQYRKQLEAENETVCA